jgi:hypothetical protein
MCHYESWQATTPKCPSSCQSIGIRGNNCGRERSLTRVCLLGSGEKRSDTLDQRAYPAGAKCALAPKAEGSIPSFPKRCAREGRSVLQTAAVTPFL